MVSRRFSEHFGADTDFPKTEGSMISNCTTTGRRIRKGTPGRNGWTEKEEVALRFLVEKHGTTNWTFIATELKPYIPKDFPHARNGSDCSERWFGKLDPTLNKEPFSETEDQLILIYQ